MAIRRYTQLDEDIEGFNDNILDGEDTEYGYMRRYKKEGVKTNTLLDDIDEDRRQKKENRDKDVKEKKEKFKENIKSAKDKTGELLNKVKNKAGEIKESENVNEFNENIRNNRHKIIKIVFVASILFFVVSVFVLVKTIISNKEYDVIIADTDTEIYDEDTEIYDKDYEDEDNEQIDVTEMPTYERYNGYFRSVLSAPEYERIFDFYKGENPNVTYLYLSGDSSAYSMIADSYAEEFIAMMSNAYRLNNLTGKEKMQILGDNYANDCKEYGADDNSTLTYDLFIQRLKFLYINEDEEDEQEIEYNTLLGIATMTNTLGTYDNKVDGGDGNYYDYQRIRQDNYDAGKEDWEVYNTFCKLINPKLVSRKVTDAGSENFDGYGEFIRYKYEMCAPLYVSFSVTLEYYGPRIQEVTFEEDSQFSNWTCGSKIWASDYDRCLEDLRKITTREISSNSPFCVKYEKSEWDEAMDRVGMNINRYERTEEEKQNKVVSAPPYVYAKDDYDYMYGLSDTNQQEYEQNEDNKVYIDESIRHPLVSTEEAFKIYDTYESPIDWVLDVLASPNMKYEIDTNPALSFETKGNNAYFYFMRSLNEVRDCHDNYKKEGRLAKYDTVDDFLLDRTYQKCDGLLVYNVFRSIEDFIFDSSNRDKNGYDKLKRFYSDIISFSGDDYSNEFPAY